MTALAPLTPHAFEITRRWLETDDVVTLDLHPVTTGIDEPRPGQFTMLYAFGAGEVPISVSGCPRDDGALRHTIRVAGPVTRMLCDLQPGAPVGVRGPFGTGWPLAASRRLDLVIVGGGIGLAPLRPILRRVASARDQYGRITLLVGARTPGDVLFRSELTAWQDDLGLDVTVTVDAAPPGWRGRVGFVTSLLPDVDLDPEQTAAFICGPEVMMAATARRLRDAGVPGERIHVSLERNMGCAVAQCGHCMLGPLFVCREGPVVPWSVAAPLFEVTGW